jgi:hypothetical protein
MSDPRPDAESAADRKLELELENARLAYRAALDMWYYYGDVLWQKHSAMIVANSVLIGAIAIRWDSESPWPTLIDKALPLLGILLCIAAVLIIERGRAFHVYGILAARELEQKHLSDTVDVLVRGARLAAGAEIIFDLGEEHTHHRLNRAARFLRTRWLSYVPLVVFAVVYMVALAAALLS